MKISIKTIASLVSLLLLTGCAEEAKEVKTKTRKKDKVELDQFIVPISDLSEDEAFKKYAPRGSSKNSWKAWLKAGESAMDDDDYQSSKKLLDESIKLYPYPRSFYLRGKSKFNSIDQKNDDGALEDFRTAIEKGYEDPELYTDISRIYVDHGKLDKSIDILSQGVSKFPNEKKILFDRANTYTLLKKDKKALHDFDKVLKIDPEFFRVYICRGQIYEQNEQYEKALKDYESSFKSQKAKAKVETRMLGLKLSAALLSKLGKHQKAVQLLTEAHQIEKDNDELLRLRGEEYVACKQYDKALKDFNQVIKTNPQFALHAYQARAKLYELQGKKELALKDRQRAKELEQAPAEETLFKMKR